MKTDLETACGGHSRNLFSGCTLPGSGLDLDLSAVDGLLVTATA